METYIVKMDGEKVRVFNNLLKANTWARKYCKGNVEIVKMIEGKPPKASRIHFNEFFENKGSYKYNPLVMEN